MQVNFTIPWLTRKRLAWISPLLVIPVIILTSASACSGGNSGAALSDNGTSAAILQHYDAVQPVYEPTGDSAYRATLTYVEAEHVLGLNTTSFIMDPSAGHGAPLFQCPSEGSAVPNTAQLDNPDLLIPETDPGNNDSTAAVVGNMDPDGVYPPSASSGTYLRCLKPNGSSYLVYSEPDVIQFNATNVTWNPSLYGGQGGFQLNDASTTAMPVCQVRFQNVTTNTGASSSPVTSKEPVTNCKAAKGTVSGNGK